jgi:hypothetical protein
MRLAAELAECVLDPEQALHGADIIRSQGREWQARGEAAVRGRDVALRLARQSILIRSLQQSVTNDLALFSIYEDGMLCAFFRMRL